METFNHLTNSDDDDRGTRQTWMRGLYMLLFIFAFGVGEILIFLVSIVQFFWMLFTGQPNRNLLRFGESLSIWVADITKFLTCVDEEKPFPWSEWPKASD